MVFMESWFSRWYCCFLNYLAGCGLWRGYYHRDFEISLGIVSLKGR